MDSEFQKALESFAENLKHKMGESKAIHFLNKFSEVSSGNAIKNLVDVLMLYVCKEYSINRETLINSKKTTPNFARITCYHILRSQVNLSIEKIMPFFFKKKRDPVFNGIEKAQSFLDVPQYNREFVEKYRAVEKHYLNYLKSNE
ncbi:MAG: hypothetical protein NVV82_00265 [Sporocytophaga sp.]|nr:hypothetical protein [Sporocytophaga sp.]